MKKYIILTIVCLLLSACQSNIPLINTQSGSGSATQTPTDSGPVILGQQTATPVPLATSTEKPKATTSELQTSPTGQIPAFDHIVLMVFENRDYEEVIGNQQMPNLNALAKQYVQLDNYFAVSHPSLPNYIALMSGGTQGITSDCTDCFVNQKNLADLITASGRTWKTYEENMPSPCFLGDSDLYVQKHNPLLYFDSVRLNSTICNHSIVPLTQLDSDLSANQLPNFSFVMPNMCNSGHECSLDKPDAWIQAMVAKLQASPAFGSNSLIAIVFDEADKSNKATCCGIGTKGGGRVAAVLISPLAKPGFIDDTAYSHYSLLKTILTAWNLPDLGMTQNPATKPILAPWGSKMKSMFLLLLILSSVWPPARPAVPDNSGRPQSVTASAGQADPQAGELQFPIRAAFYYPWFPEAWDQQGMKPFTHYRPDLGYYNQNNVAVIKQHILEMQYGKIQAGISSWWGRGQPTDRRVADLLKLGEQMGFHWSLYVESEGIGNPGPDAIRSDLEYIRDHYATSPAYLKIGGRFVVFVYAEPADSCEMAARWKNANTVGAYLVLKIFTGYRYCYAQPDAWHQYAPADAEKRAGSDSFTISPGFWKGTEPQLRLSRDLDRWSNDIQAMIASKANFQLISTFNEWGEGTAVENARQWSSSSTFGSYLDALHYDGTVPSSKSQLKIVAPAVTCSQEMEYFFTGDNSGSGRDFLRCFTYFGFVTHCVCGTF